MELQDVVGLMASETFTDAFNSRITFVGKVNPFAEVTNSGSSSQRRILETPTTELIPEGRVVVCSAGVSYIVANQNIDYWFTRPIRYKYSVLPATGIAEVGDIGDTLGGTQPDKAVYIFPFFVRREIDEDEMSDFLSGYELYFPNVKTFNRGSIVKLGDSFFRLKTDTWRDGAGYSVSQAVLLEEPIRVLTAVDSDPVNYNPVTDKHASQVPVEVTCFVEPLKQDYKFVSASFDKIEPGDLAISALKTDIELGVGDRLDSYRVVSVRDNGTWNTYQCRNLS